MKRSPSSWERFMNRRAPGNVAYSPTDIEHLANICTHALLIAPSLYAWYCLLSPSHSPRQILSASIYGGALVLLFTVSAVFHLLSYVRKLRQSKLRTLFHYGDRAVIYVFIAASYTPWLMLRRANAFGNIALVGVWISATLGILYQLTFHERYKWLETTFYLMIGVCPSIVVLDMPDREGIAELAYGGFTYILGVLFFKCDGRIPFAHAIWHLFVSAGASFHYYAIYTYLLSSPLDVPFQKHDDL